MPPKRKSSFKSISKFHRSRWLILFCHGPKPGKKCGYCIELCRITAHWTICPLCGGKLTRQWHYAHGNYKLDDDYDPYSDNGH